MKRDGNLQPDVRLDTVVSFPLVCVRHSEDARSALAAAKWHQWIRGDTAVSITATATRATN